MLYEMKKKSDISNLMKCGKASGALLLNLIYPELSKINNFYVLDSKEELDRIIEKLPDRVALRADSPLGEKPITGIRGRGANKNEIGDYIGYVKEKNPVAFVICMDTNTEKRRNNIDGSFNVYFDWEKMVYIDFLGKGFDVGGLTKGEEKPHEIYCIPWEDLLFVKPNTMNQYRVFLASDSLYSQSVNRKRKHLVEHAGVSEEEAKQMIPEKYQPVSTSVKEEIIDRIIFGMFTKRRVLTELKIKSFGIQGMIRDGELAPIEVYRRERFIDKELFKEIESRERIS